MCRDRDWKIEIKQTAGWLFLFSVTGAKGGAGAKMHVP